MRQEVGPYLSMRRWIVCFLHLNLRNGFSIDLYNPFSSKTNVQGNISLHERVFVIFTFGIR